MSTNQPSRSANHVVGQSAANGVDDLLLDDLVIQTLEAERFEQVALGQTQPALRLAGSAASRPRLAPVLRVGSLAAAAAVAVGSFIVFSNPKPAPTPRPLPGGGGSVALNPDSTPKPRPTDPIVLTASAEPARDSDDKLASFAHLDPELIDGVPTLTGERSLVVAVYRGVEASTQDCDCLTWSVEDSHSAAAKPELLASALHTPCGGASREVTLVSITGPREMLPFHDDDARELVRCITDFANESDADPCVTDDLCQATLASLCLPAELSIRTLSVRLGE